MSNRVIGQIEALQQFAKFIDVLPADHATGELLAVAKLAIDKAWLAAWRHAHGTAPASGDS